MNKKLNTESIRQLLNRSSAQLDPSTLTRLRDVRAQALARYDVRSTAPAFAWAGVLNGSWQGSHRSHYFWGGILLLAVLLFGSVTYLHRATEHDTSDVDIAILTDDLPIDAYVD